MYHVSDYDGLLTEMAVMLVVRVLFDQLDYWHLERLTLAPPDGLHLRVHMYGSMSGYLD